MTAVPSLAGRFDVKLTDNDDRWMPERAYEFDAGFDLKLRAVKGIDDPKAITFVLKPHERVLAFTGVKLALRPGWEAQIRPRSGNALKKGITVLNTPGTVDCQYRGEIGVILHNDTDSPVSFAQGDKIAQMVVKEVPRVELRQTYGELDDTARGDGGFGSTGE